MGQRRQWDKSGTFIWSPNSKYQIKGAVPACMAFREPERFWNGIWRDEPRESLLTALMQFNGNAGSSGTTPSISSDCAAFPVHQNASQTGQICWCYICYVYVHVFITQNKCTSICNLFTTVDCTHDYVHYVDKDWKKRLKIFNILVHQCPAGEEKHSQTVMMHFHSF